MSRTSASLTNQEVKVFQAFCRANRIALDGEDGEKNGALFAEVIGLKMNADFTEENLEIAFEQLKGKLKLVSEMYQRADELARAMTTNEQQIYREWAARQKYLVGIDGSPEGVENCATLLGWFRGNAVTAHNLDLALGNIVNNAKFGRIHFHARPPQQDRSVVGGKPNHAFNYEEPKAAAVGQQQEFHPSGRRNHSYVDPAADAAKKVTQPVDAWQRVIELQLKEWTTPNQQARLEGEYNAGVKAGKSWSDISMALAGIIKDRQRGR
jgi:hypothetical protein